MQVTCEGCAAPHERDGLDAVEGGFGFVCPRCDRVNVLAPMAAPPTSSPAPDPEPEPEPLPPGVVECPKCGHQQRDPEACHRCGLMFSRAGRLDSFDSDPLAGHPAAEAVRARWVKLEADPGDAEGHHAFIRMCAESNLLEFAGARYRRLADRLPEDERVAQYRQRVIAAAMARVGSLEQRATDRTNHRLRGLIALSLGALILLAFAVGYYLLNRYQTAWQVNG